MAATRTDEVFGTRSVDVAKKLLLTTAVPKATVELVTAAAKLAKKAPTPAPRRRPREEDNVQGDHREGRHRPTSSPG
jgi:hypothetical protein